MFERTQLYIRKTAFNLKSLKVVHHGKSMEFTFQCLWSQTDLPLCLLHALEGKEAVVGE